MQNGTGKTTRGIQNKVLLTLLAVAAMSSVVRDLNRFHSWASVIFNTVTSVHTKGFSSEVLACSQTAPQDEPSGQFHWAGRLVPGQGIEVKQISVESDAEPTVGGEVELMTNRHVRKGPPATVNVSSSAHACANRVNHEIDAKVADVKLKEASALKMVNRGVTVDLPVNLNTKLEASTFTSESFSDFAVTVMNSFGHRRTNATTGAVNKDLVIKTLHGNFRLRRAG